MHTGDPYLAGLQTVVTAEDWTRTLRISSGIDGAVTNAGVARYGDLSARHLTVLARREPDPSSVLLVARTTQSQVRVAVAARTTAVGGAATTSRRLWQEPGRIGHELELPMRPGVAVTIDKVATLVTSRDVAISEPALTAVELLADASGFDDLLISHELAWRQLWRRFRLDLTDGIAHGATETVATDTLRTLRLSTFHVLQTVSLHAADLDVGIPARGLHGEAYRGHVFWDELFVFPMLTLRMPSARPRPAAVPRAAAAAPPDARPGRPGIAGRCSPGSRAATAGRRASGLHLNPRSGRWLPDTTHLPAPRRSRRRLQRLAVLPGHRRPATSSPIHGAEMMLEIARFFADLAVHDPATDRYAIRGVMGPDEYHTALPRRHRSRHRRQRLHQRDDRLAPASGPRRARGVALPSAAPS